MLKKKAIFKLIELKYQKIKNEYQKILQKIKIFKIKKNKKDRILNFFKLAKSNIPKALNKCASKILLKISTTYFRFYFYFRNLTKKQKIIYGLVFLIILIDVFPAIINAQAKEGSGGGGTTSSTEGSVLFTALGWTFYFIWYLSGAVVKWGGLLLDAVISKPGFNYEVVSHGWTITRDFANMLFIVAILIVSFSTILNLGPLKNYHIKAILPKIVIVALTINLSLYAVMLVAGSGDLLMKAMMKPQGDTSLAGKFAIVANVSRVARGDLNKELEGDNWVGYFGRTNLEVLVKTVVGAVVFTLLGFSFMALAGMFFIRTVVLMFLAVFGPMAMIAWIIPNTQSYFNKWVKMLFQYSFMGPLLTFMILMSLTLLLEFLWSDIEGSGVGLDLWNLEDEDLQYLTGAVFIALMTIGSMMAAQKLGFIGGAQLYGAARNAARKFITNTATAPWKLGGMAVKKGLWNKGLNRRGAFTKAFDSVLADASKMPIIGQSVAGMRAKYGKKREDEVKKWETYLGDTLSDEELQNTYIHDVAGRTAQKNLLASKGLDYTGGNAKYAKAMAETHNRYNYGGDADTKWGDIKNYAAHGFSSKAAMFDEAIRTGKVREMINRMSPSQLNDPEIVDLINSKLTRKEADDILYKSKQHTKAAGDALYATPGHGGVNGAKIHGQVDVLNAASGITHDEFDEYIYGMKSKTETQKNMDHDSFDNLITSANSVDRRRARKIIENFDPSNINNDKAKAFKKVFTPKYKKGLVSVANKNIALRTGIPSNIGNLNNFTEGDLKNVPSKVANAIRVYQKIF